MTDKESEVDKELLEIVHRFQQSMCTFLEPLIKKVLLEMEKKGIKE